MNSSFTMFSFVLKHHASTTLKVLLGIFFFNFLFAAENNTLYPKNTTRPRIAVVLSGGGARSIAQLGVLKVLERRNIPIDCIVGNSMGSVIGGMYASGYSLAEIESIALHTDWNSLLSLSGETERSSLFIGQKEEEEQGFLLLRMEGLQPILPSAISSGQRLTNFLNELCLQSLYYPQRNFDELKIPFRSVATDLISGTRMIMSRGSLSEALRASISVPLMFSAFKKDSMLLLDGGLVSNIPVDVAREQNMEIIIAVNTTSKLRTLEQMKAPWESADQIMSIMMEMPNRKQLENADVVITPEIGNTLSSDFSHLPLLIAEGENAAEKKLNEITALLTAKRKKIIATAEHTYSTASIRFRGDVPDSVRQRIEEKRKNNFSEENVQQFLFEIQQQFPTANVYAEIQNDSAHSLITFVAEKNPILREIRFSGNLQISLSPLRSLAQHNFGKEVSASDIRNLRENILKYYRANGYSLAEIESVAFTNDGALAISINEGTIDSIRVKGNFHTQEYVILRELSFERGDVFSVEVERECVKNILSTGLFEQVYLDVEKDQKRKNTIVVSVQEKSTEIIRAGFRIDNERNFQLLLDARQVNFLSAGQDLGLTFAGGFRNRLFRARYNVNRIFDTYFTGNIKSYYKLRDVFLYAKNPEGENDLDRISIGEYREIKYGGTFSFGSQVARFGNVNIEMRAENHETKEIATSKYFSGFSGERFTLASLKGSVLVDSENEFVFPTSGIRFSASYELASKSFGSERSFTKIFSMYESYFTLFQLHTLRPRVTFGFADATLPLSEQFSLGGFESFLGRREDDERGRQLFVVNMEYRFKLPFKILFETYFKARYDVGMISKEVREIAMHNFQHGAGIELALDTPIGSAAVAVGKSFVFMKSLPKTKVEFAPTLAYFSVGHKF